MCPNAKTTLQVHHMIQEEQQEQQSDSYDRHVPRGQKWKLRLRQREEIALAINLRNIFIIFWPLVPANSRNETKIVNIFYLLC